jgi:cytidylate kinase
MIITVSRQYGSDGETIARSVAATLGLHVVDRDAIRAAALQAGIAADLLQRLMYSGQRKVADEFIEGLGSLTPEVTATAASNPLLSVFAPPVSTNVVSLEEAARAIGGIIRSIASRGDVMILGQGGQALLQGEPGVCHVLFVAPFQARVKRVAEWHRLSMRDAQRQVRGMDESRRDYLDRYHNVRWLDPLLYHLVINTGVMAAGDAAALVIRAARGAAGAPRTE